LNGYTDPSSERDLECGFFTILQVEIPNGSDELDEERDLVCYAKGRDGGDKEVAAYRALSGHNLGPGFRESFNRRPREGQIPWELVGWTTGRNVVYWNDVTIPIMPESVPRLLSDIDVH
jgi:hypothetical protein